MVGNSAQEMIVINTNFTKQAITVRGLPFSRDPDASGERGGGSAPLPRGGLTFYQQFLAIGGNRVVT